ncbi:MAG: FAD-binding oxidoreductase [Alphaproteobacteria bacterium]
MDHTHFLAELQAIVGDTGVVTEELALERYTREWRGKYLSGAIAAVRPSNTQQVSEVVKLCAANGISITPQGGNTGLVGGSIPIEPTREIVLSLDRMNAVEDVDPDGNTMLVQAGCILAEVQAAAEQCDRLFPLSLGAEGSCRIGGNLSTNAGGINVIRYGNTRDLVLGLEVVLADGRIWNGMNRLRKDNTGYDLKQLFVGSEGTLGIITRAVLKIFPRPKDRLTAWLACESPEACLEALNMMRERLGDAIIAGEIIPAIALEQTLQHIEDTSAPINPIPPWSLLIEVGVFDEAGAIRDTLDYVLQEAVGREVLYDGTIAQNMTQAAQFWRIREAIPEAEAKSGPSIKHDVSVPVHRVAELIERGSALLEELYPGSRPVPFGHLGDGNLHFNLCAPTEAVGDPAAEADFLNAWSRINMAFHDLVREMNGSISAEHGIGQLKKDELARTADKVGISLMQTIKAALDPQNIFNRGKIF